MIVHDVEQGSDQWRALRMGVVTASRIDKIITPKTMKPSSSAMRLMGEMIAEKWTGMPMDTASSAFMERGSIMEAEAVRAYEMLRDVDTRKVGFVTLDNGLVGCSPDRLVGDDGILEIKVASAGIHVMALLGECDDDYRCQCQCQLWVTERKWVDLSFYSPVMPPATVRAVRDEKFIEAMSELTAQFLDRMADAERRLGLPERLQRTA